MNRLIQQAEKGKFFFEKVSRNICLGAIRDGFLTAVPATLPFSISILIASIPDVFGVTLPEDFSNWLWKTYNYSAGVTALLASATTARCLAEPVNRKIPGNKKISTVSAILASIVSLLTLSVSELDGGLASGYIGMKDILTALVVAFITVNVYESYVIHDITIKMSKEVPGTISQTSHDIFPFPFAVLVAAIIDTIVHYFFGTSFAEAVITLLQPLFTTVDGYLGAVIIWGAMALFWFIGVHGPSIVEPIITAIIYANVETNLQLFKAGEHASNVLTTGLGNFVGTMGDIGVTLVVPYLFLLFARSKQLEVIGKASSIPVSFAINEPLPFATPIVPNPYLFVPFLLAPIANVWIFKFFVGVLQTNSFMYVLPWAALASIGLTLSIGVSLLATALILVLIVVDAIIYFPFIKAYDVSLLGEEAEITAQEIAAESATPVETAAEKVAERESVVKVTTDKPIDVLALCASADTSAMLVNALTGNVVATGANITTSAGVYGSHYEIMRDFDMIVLAPQVNSFYEDIKKDTDALGIRLVAIKSAEYIKLTCGPKDVVAFIMPYFA